MDASRFKRRSIQTQRQVTQKPFGNAVPVPEVGSVRPRRIAYVPMDRAEKLRIAKAKAAFLRQISNKMIQASREASAPVVSAPPNPPKVIYAPMTNPEPPEAPASRRSLLDMSLPGEESHLRSTKLGVKWRRARKLAFRGMALSVVLVITLGGLFVSQGYLKVHKVFKGTAGTATALNSEVNPNLLSGEGDGRVNILLMGRGGGKNTAPDLTDTMMVMSIDPINHSATLLSVPRDLWVKVPAGGPMKINAAWETGVFKYTGKIKTGSTDPKAIEAGFQSADTAVEDVLGIKIHYNMIVNFDAFKQAVDTVGGITVNAPADLVDPTMAGENANNPVLAKAGSQTLDGTHALIYARSRETTSDFARAERQRAIFLALKGKVQQIGTLSNPVKISGLLTAFGNNVSTDLSFSNASRLYKIMKSIGEQNITSTSLADPSNSYIIGSTYKGQSIIVPKAGKFDFTGIHSYVRTQLKDPYIQKENAKILVMNGTLIPGIANKMGDVLKTYGYNVIPSSNTPNSSWTQTTLVDLTHKNKYTRNYLENRLGTTASNHLADTSIPTNGADFVIIMGSDEAITAQTQSN